MNTAGDCVFFVGFELPGQFDSFLAYFLHVSLAHSEKASLPLIYLTIQYSCY